MWSSQQLCGSSSASSSIDTGMTKARIRPYSSDKTKLAPHSIAKGRCWLGGTGLPPQIGLCWAALEQLMRQQTALPAAVAAAAVLVPAYLTAPAAEDADLSRLSGTHPQPQSLTYL